MSADKRDFGPASIPSFGGQPSNGPQGLDALAVMFSVQNPAVAEPTKKREHYDPYLDPNPGSAPLSVEAGGATSVAPETHLNSATDFGLVATHGAGVSLKGSEEGDDTKPVEPAKSVHAGKPSADGSNPGKPGRHAAPKASAAPAPAAPAASGHTMSTEFGSPPVGSSKPNASDSPEPAPAPTPEPAKPPVTNRVVGDAGIGRYGGTITLTPQPQQPKNPSKGQPAQEPQTGKSEAKPSAEQPSAAPWDGTYDDDEEDPQELAKWYNERRAKSEPPEPSTPPQAGKSKAEPLAQQPPAPYVSHNATDDDYRDLGGEPAKDVQHPGSKNLLEAIAAAQAAEPRVKSHAGRHKKPQGRLNRLIYGNPMPDVSRKPNSMPQPNANKKESRLGSWRRKVGLLGAAAVLAAGVYGVTEASGGSDSHYVPKHKATVSQPTGNPTTSHNSSSFISDVFKGVKTVEAMQAVEVVDQALNTSTPMPVETDASATKHAPVVHTTLELGHYRQGDHSGAGTVSGLALQALEERGVAHPSAAQIHNVATQIWQFNGEHGDPYTSKKAIELPSDMHLSVPSHLIF